MGMLAAAPTTASIAAKYTPAEIQGFLDKIPVALQHADSDVAACANDRDFAQYFGVPQDFASVVRGFMSPGNSDLNWKDKFRAACSPSS